MAHFRPAKIFVVIASTLDDNLLNFIIYKQFVYSLATRDVVRSKLILKCFAVKLQYHRAVFVRHVDLTAFLVTAKNSCTIVCHSSTIFHHRRFSKISSRDETNESTQQIVT